MTDPGDFANCDSNNDARSDIPSSAPDQVSDKSGLEGQIENTHANEKSEAQIHNTPDPRDER